MSFITVFVEMYKTEGKEVMQTIKIITKKGHSENYQCWCTTNDPKFYMEFIQYILDSANNPEAFIIWDVTENHFYNLYEVATKYYGIEKEHLMKE